MDLDELLSEIYWPDYLNDPEPKPKKEKKKSRLKVTAEQFLQKEHFKEDELNTCDINNQSFDYAEMDMEARRKRAASEGHPYSLDSWEPSDAYQMMYDINRKHNKRKKRPMGPKI